MTVALDRFHLACPGLVPTRDMMDALAGLAANSNAAQIQAAVLPLVPEGNAGQYTRGAPPAVPLPMPRATPVYPAALPPQPVVLLPVDGNPALGTVATFAKGLPLFADSNPDPIDGWSLERGGDEDCW